MRIKLLQTTITRAPAMAECGTTLAFAPSDYQPVGDISGRFNGYYQGHEELIDAEMEDGYSLRDTDQEVALLDPSGKFVTDDANVAVDMQIVRRVVTA